MNICFYTSFGVSPIQGGTERITCTVAKSLTEKYGCKCYSLYSSKARTGDIPDFFLESLLMPNLKKEKERLAETLRRWKIDILVNQGSFYLSPIFHEILGEMGAKYVFCHHFEPGWETHFLSLTGTIRAWKAKPTIKSLARVFLFPYFKIKDTISLPKSYAETYHLADKVILLSGRFIPQFMAYGGIKDRSKFGVIFNGLSFSTFFDPKRLSEKEKIVLVVSRIDEVQKRISDVLRVWNEVEKNGKYDDWKLVLVGDGPDLPRYKRQASRLGLRHISFEGTQSPEDYYRRASLFLMTSASEGWGLTLTESQQYGCVPLAFDTYASLHEIITDGYNGSIIPKGDIRGYAERVESLMEDSAQRMQLAVNAIESSHRFEQGVIAQQWYDILSGLLSHHSESIRAY